MENKKLLRYALTALLSEHDGDWLALQDDRIFTLEVMQQSLRDFAKSDARAHLKLVKFEP